MLKTNVRNKAHILEWLEITENKTITTSTHNFLKQFIQIKGLLSQRIRTILYEFSILWIEIWILMFNLALTYKVSKILHFSFDFEIWFIVGLVIYKHVYNSHSTIWRYDNIVSRFSVILEYTLDLLIYNMYILYVVFIAYNYYWSEISIKNGYLGLS